MTPHLFLNVHTWQRTLCQLHPQGALQHVQKDNVVYHGLAGHFFLLNIPHVLKIRIIADMEARVKEEVRRENISEEKALYILKKR